MPTDTTPMIRKKKQIEPKRLATIAAKFWKAEILMHEIKKHTNEELS